MPLSIGVQKGQKIQIGASVIEVTGVVQDVMIEVTTPNGKKHVLTDQENVEILPKVFAFYGHPPGKRRSGPRISFEAPREIAISRVPHG